jgi:Family of unknown function (DUF6307)
VILTDTYVSRYDQRINLVVDALRQDPESTTDAAMPEDTARRLAGRVLQALDHIPETVR